MKTLRALTSFATTTALCMTILPVHAEEFRSVDGSGNNVGYPQWGAANTQLMRITTSAYGNGHTSPSGSQMPGARYVSFTMCSQSGSTLNDRNLTDMVWQWGQFIDHDFSLTEMTDPAEPLNIEVPAGDPMFDPGNTGTQTIPLTRSRYDHTTGSEGNPREQMNSLTSFLDASQVYGSDAVRAAALRTFTGGLLKTTDNLYLPYNETGLPNAGSTSNTFFLAGDVRANEQLGLTAIHTLFVREHNRLARQIALDQPEMNDEEIYQRARQLVGAQIQAITYNEFLPALLGSFPSYDGYDPTINASVSNEFATIAFRLGHSMLSEELLRLSNDGTVIPEGNILLKDTFFRPEKLRSEGGIDPLLKGLITQRMQEVDVHAIDGIVNFLFGPPGAGGLDLMALDVQRARDHGMPDYNSLRRDFGMEPVEEFSDITDDEEMAESLEQMYGSVDTIDGFIGMLVEDHTHGSVGSLLHTMLKDQFMRTRSGDRFWYENVLSPQDIAVVNNTKLSDIIKRNTDLTNVQKNVFKTTSPFPAVPEIELPDIDLPGGITLPTIPRIEIPRIELPKIDLPTLPVEVPDIRSKIDAIKDKIRRR